MTRIEVLNAIIKKKNVANYLEIGVNRGKCLFNIVGPKNRFAVDPFFNFNLFPNPLIKFRSIGIVIYSLLLAGQPSIVSA